jgi:outer membrane protein assembly factor BamB
MQTRYPAPLFCLVASLHLWACAEAKGSEWARFRGPNGLGVAESAEGWSAEPALVWKTELPGPGGSSAVISGDRIYLTSHGGYAVPGSPDGEITELTRHLLCLDRADGTRVWEQTIKAVQPEQPKVRDHGYASSTPFAEEGRIYVFFGKSGVFAFDPKGTQLWRADVGSRVHGWGSAASPVVYKDLVIVNASVESGALVALNKNSGEEVWRAGGIKESWNTPIFVPVAGGKTELVVAIMGAVLGFDPENGEQLWSCETGIGWYMVPSLVNDQDVVYCIGGRTGGALAVRAGGRGNVTASRRLWSSNKGSNVPSPILYQGHLYWLHENLGIAYCAEAATGKLIFEERLEGAGQFYASPVCVDGKLYCVSRRGSLFTLAASPQFKQLGRKELRDGGSFDASPSIVGARLLVRSDRFLYCLGQK